MITIRAFLAQKNEQVYSFNKHVLALVYPSSVLNTVKIFLPDLANFQTGLIKFGNDSEYYAQHLAAVFSGLLVTNLLEFFPLCRSKELH